MDLTIFLYLSSGLFLGWSLGANDAANVFGTAVGTRMIKFATAAIICSVLVGVGAVVSGAGAAHTLSKLGNINALGGAFVAAFAAAATVAWLTVLGLPVSTTQAIVGAIIGWNFFSGSVTDFTIFKTIVGTWFISPVLTAIVSYLMYRLVMKYLVRVKIHVIRQDALVRLSLLIAGCLGAYSLGANNIANVMGVFIGANPFTDISLGLGTFTGLQQLFLLGSLAIAVGVSTYGKKVMMTVGDSLFTLTPVAAIVVVLATSLTLFLFASEDLEYFLASMGLPTIPLVPVSSSQAVVGGVIGIGLIKNAHNIQWKVAGRITWAWVQTPVVSALISFLMLFMMQNLFGMTVFNPVEYRLAPQVLERHQTKLDIKALAPLQDKPFASSGKLKKEIDKLLPNAEFKDRLKLIDDALVEKITVDPAKFPELEKTGVLDEEQMHAVKQLSGKSFTYRWELVESLARSTPKWQLKESTVLNKPYNKDIRKSLDLLLDLYTPKMA